MKSEDPPDHVRAVFDQIFIAQPKAIMLRLAPVSDKSDVPGQRQIDHHIQARGPVPIHEILGHIQHRCIRRFPLQMVRQADRGIIDIAGQDRRADGEPPQQFQVRRARPGMLMADHVHGPGVNQIGQIQILLVQLMIAEKKGLIAGCPRQHVNEKGGTGFRQGRDKDRFATPAEQLFQAQVQAQNAARGGLQTSFQALGGATVHAPRP